MEFKDLKEGLPVRWRASRPFRGWDAYGRVTAVGLSKATILTYDDFKETELSKGGEAVRDEVEPCGEDEVRRYLLARAGELRDRSARLEAECREKVAELGGQVSKLRELLEGR